MTADGATAAAPARTTGPYVGLSYYTEADAEWFFGREDDCRTIVANLRAARLTVLYAPSGVGKSSLLRAGVARQLRTHTRRGLAQRRSARYLPVVFSEWKDNPPEELIAAVEADMQPLLPAGTGVELPRHELAAALEQAATAVDAQPLIILDQFEEYLLYRSEEDAERRLVDELARCLNSRSLRANFLIAIREDAYAGLGELFAGKLLNVYGNYLQLDYLHRDAAREAIVGPIEHFNELNPDEQPIAVEPELIDAVLDEVTTEQPTAGAHGQAAGATGVQAQRDEIEAPYLQLVMSKLWSHEREQRSSVLRFDTLQRLGGARAIIRTHLDSALDALSSEEYDTALGIFHYLVTPSGSKIVFTATDLAELVERPYAQVAGLLSKLAAEDKRIVRHVPPPAGRSEPSDRYELFHDVLAPAIVAWRRDAIDQRRRAADARERDRLEREKHEADARTREEARRRRAFQRLAAGALALLVVAVVLGIVALVEKHHAVSNLHAAQSSQLVAGAEQTLGGDPALSTLLALRALRVKYTPQAETALREALPQLQELKALPVGSAVNRAVFSLDGTKIVTASESGTAIIWDLASGRPIRTLDGDHGVAESAAFNADGTEVVTATKDGTARVWSATTGKRLSVLRADSGVVNGAAFSPNGAEVVTATERGGAIIFNARAGTRRLTLREPGRVASVESAAFSPDGTKVVTASERGTTIIWDAETGTPLKSLPGLGAQGAAFSPDGTRIVTAGARGTVRIWDWRSGKQSAPLSAQGAILDAAFSPDGAEIVTADQNGTADVWDASSGRLLTALSGAGEPVRGAAFSPDGQEVVTADRDGTARIWRVAPRERGTVLHGNATGEVLSAAFDANGTKVVTANQNLTASIWNLAEPGTQPLTLSGDLGPVQSAEFSRDGTRVVTASADGTARIWDAETGHQLAVLRGHDGPVRTAAFSPNGGEVVIANKGGTAIIWDAQRARQRHVLRRPGHTTRVESAAFSPDGATVVTTSEDGAATLWDAASGKLERTWRASGVAVLYAAFSPDGSELITASKDGTASIWDASGKRVLTLAGGGGPLYSAAFSPDGSDVVTPSEAGRVTVWNARSGKRLTVLNSDEGVVFSAAFSPDGRKIVMANQDGSATIWDTELAGPLPALERIARARDKHQLTAAERATYLG